MTGSDDRPESQAKQTKSGSREARLAAALRENLRRRKAQERARVQDEAPAGGKPDGRENR